MTDGGVEEFKSYPEQLVRYCKLLKKRKTSWVALEVSHPLGNCYKMFILYESNLRRIKNFTPHFYEILYK